PPARGKWGGHDARCRRRTSRPERAAGAGSNGNGVRSEARGARAPHRSLVAPAGPEGAVGRPRVPGPPLACAIGMGRPDPVAFGAAPRRMARTQGPSPRLQRLGAFVATALLAAATAVAFGRVFATGSATVKLLVTGLASAAVAAAF